MWGIPDLGALPPNSDLKASSARAEINRAVKEREEKEGNRVARFALRIGPPLAPTGKCGRIPINDYHKSASEGEGACSKTSAGRSHLPLRGKLGWMTPRPGQKKTGKRNASTGGSCSQARAPILFRVTRFRSTPFLVDRRQRTISRQPTKSALLLRRAVRSLSTLNVPRHNLKLRSKPSIPFRLDRRAAGLECSPA